MVIFLGLCEFTLMYGDSKSNISLLMCIPSNVCVSITTYTDVFFLNTKFVYFSYNNEYVIDTLTVELDMA